MTIPCLYAFTSIILLVVKISRLLTVPKPFSKAYLKSCLKSFLTALVINVYLFFIVILFCTSNSTYFCSVVLSTYISFISLPKKHFLSSLEKDLSYVWSILLSSLYVCIQVYGCNTKTFRRIQ